jgi:putative ABC transport system permease protein
MPMLDVHLYSGDIEDELQGKGDIAQIGVLTALALLLLLIACINYMNLATARSEQKFKVVAINKTLGATSGQMVMQFLVETGLITLLALGVSALLVLPALPYFSRITDRQILLSDLLQPVFLVGLPVGWLVLTLIAGSYPALFLSAHRPIDLLRKNSRMRFGGLSVRKGLVIFQFCVSSVLIVSTLLLNQQLNYISDKKLGFDPEQVIAIRVQGLPGNREREAVERELERLPGVLNTVRSQSYPGQSTSVYNISRPDAPEGQGAELTACRAQPDIIDVLDLELIAGKTLKIRAAEDTITQVILNRAAVEFMGWTPEEALGNGLDNDLGYTEIVGVVEDFHYTSLHKPIGFYAFHNRGDTYMPYLLLKLQTADLSETLAQIQSTFEKTAPSVAFDYTFLDESLEQLYRTEEKLAKLVLIFAGLAILIACLGIFALTAFATERRTKEIGIRKVLGATVQDIVNLLSKEFLQLTLVAFLLAIPLSWWMMNRWLQDFAYRIEISWWVFAVAGVLALSITLLTTGFQSLRAALTNTANSLKTE